MSEAFKPILSLLADGGTLSEDNAGDFFAACLRGDPTPAQVGAALTAMRMRGETLGEIVACARAMRQAAIRIAPPYPILDVCGGPPSSSSPSTRWPPSRCSSARTGPSR